MTATLSDGPETITPTGAPAGLSLQRTAVLARAVVAGPQAETIATTTPLTGELVGVLPLSTARDVGVAFATARAAQRAWAERPVRQRAAIVLAFHDLLLSRRDEALDVVQWETGKARKHAVEELLDVAVNARYYARTTGRLLAPTRRRGALPLLTQTTQLHHPKGVVGIIAPWNYPLTLAISDAIPALMAGNGIVLKPDSQTAFIALWARDVLLQAGLPEELFQVVVGPGSILGPAMIEQADYVCFTGSTRTGRDVARRCGERLIGCSLELGGKNAMIVCADANIDRAVEGAVRACFSNAGQLCISIERLYVADEVYDAFVPAFARAVDAMRLSARLDYSADMGSLASQDQLDAVRRHVEDAVERGARVLAGGRARPDVGPFFHEPTVLEGVTTDMAVCDEETFGPVVSVYRFTDEADAIARANATAYGLNASVWARDTRRGRAIAARLRAGTVNVNEGYGPAWGSVDAPMGGMGDSGLGRRHGAEGLLKYTEAQTVAVQRLQGFGAPRHLSDEQWARLLTFSVGALKKVGWR
ncbi:MAG: succinic semialdehyde dehydrogenase [Actinomycetia bacterium]|jgi:succinate-semialdehyde dehydrogenase/glutarate-semialdehyde dehydrogenase|nr:succinic semialdehyde dehydrogenase [Actinomycetes bacterium]